MKKEERKDILLRARKFFKEKIAENHIKNTKKLSSLDIFNVNPFLVKYLANFAFGEATSENIARALIYPRILGTSINTSFGSLLQIFCNEILTGYASVIPGLDIEFIDSIDGRKKYCQVKAGPNTINKDDVKTILDHFKDIKNIARTNRQTDINPSIDCIVGVFYGEQTKLSTFYKRISQDYSVIVGQEFWHHLTGDENFYFDLANAFAEVAVEMDSRKLIEDTVQKLALEIEQRNRIM
ncbi:hypothetical protein SDC9_26125 [bioreactor metagenome]|uniref:Type II restriction endonuclease EcoO109IR domain-containing protein n=1 Tax=bioreactor metagenome TaxID=1076179 RepID=A0A644UMV2_9ZZZZ|nr:PmeII family type II restriction endonuclease [Acidaminococcaceae bacterium]